MLLSKESLDLNGTAPHRGSVGIFLHQHERNDMPTLESFLNTPADIRNQWISFADGKGVCFVRKSRRLLKPRSFVDCLDIGSVSIEEDKNKGKGLFTKFLTHFEQTASERGCEVYIESILNERLKRFLIVRGYLQAEIDQDSYYKIIPEKPPEVCACGRKTFYSWDGVTWVSKHTILSDKNPKTGNRSFIPSCKRCEDHERGEDAKVMSGLW